MNQNGFNLGDDPPKLPKLPIGMGMMVGVAIINLALLLGLVGGVLLLIRWIF